MFLHLKNSAADGMESAGPDGNPKDYIIKEAECIDPMDPKLLPRLGETGIRTLDLQIFKFIVRTNITYSLHQYKLLYVIQG